MGLNLPDQLRISQMEASTDFLLQIKTLFDINAFIAGGAPRDWYFDKPANDVDIFFQSHIPFRKTLVDLVLQTIPGSKCLGEDVPWRVGGDYWCFMPGVRRVIPFEFKGHRIDLVQVQSCMGSKFQNYIFEVFDSDICRIGWDSDVKWRTTKVPYLTPDYVLHSDFRVAYDSQSLVFRFRHNNSDLKFRPDHVLKVVHKFPDRQVIFTADHCREQYLGREHLCREHLSHLSMLSLLQPFFAADDGEHALVLKDPDDPNSECFFRNTSYDLVKFDVLQNARFVFPDNTEYTWDQLWDVARTS